MRPNLHEKTMEQNRKHHRRRRPSQPRHFGQFLTDPNASQQPNKDDDTMILLTRRHHPKSPVTTSPLLVYILYLSLSILLLSHISTNIKYPNHHRQQFLLPANAQQQHNFLLPGHNMENLRIPESQPIDSIVYQLKAADRLNENRKFSYHMTGDTFSLDESTGEVKLIKPLDRERQPVIVVVISVFDNSDSKNDLPVESKRRTIVVEDIDDSWPVFGWHKSSLTKNVPQGHYIYQVELSELAPINSVVVNDIQVTDADEGSNAEVVFECRSRQSTNSACDSFSVESRRLQSGRYSVTVRTKVLLDYERIQAYRMSLVARGRKSSPIKGVPLESEAIIHINLINIQDEGPQFINAPYSLSMFEGIKPETRLLNLIVHDGDSAPQRNLSMIVVPGPFSEYFQVVKDSDKIWYLETNNTIDRENPLISEMGNMFTISLLAAELDDSGLPIASEVELLNALREPNYSKGTLKKENVTIMVLDLPDSRPVFLQASTGKPLKDNSIEINIFENIVTGASIPNLDLAVRDLDQGINSRFNLSLVDTELGPLASSAFALESEIIYGKAEVVLNVLNSTLLDYENPNLRTYRFNLVASKNFDPSLVQILSLQVNIMDANDNGPEFERDQYVFDVPEGSVPGTIVATIRARDRDSGNFGKIDYMLRGSGASKFKLVSSEGKIIVNDCGVSQCLDYETQASFSLTYEARDGGGRTKNVSVIINVADINDHVPRFTESVYKRELISDNLSSKQNYISPQLIVRAKDGDGPSQGKNNLTYRIRSSNLTSLDVDPISGLVYLSQPLDLDNMISNLNSAANSGQQRPQHSQRQQPSSPERKIVFEAEVVAEDNGQPMQNSTAKILLVVKGNPDGAPQFKQDSYQAIVRENQPINKPFFQVQAIDPDDKDSQLRYSLGYDLNDLVSINPTTGELSFKSKIDYDEFNGVPYNITVYATDNSRPYPLRASAVVSIQIQDVNDEAPKFEWNEYKATLVQGKTKPGDVVLRVRATDLDRNAQLNYSIISDQLTIHDRNGQQFNLDDIANSTMGYLSFMSRVDRLQLVSSLKKLFYINKTTGAIELKSEPDYSFAASITILVRVLDLNQEIFFPTGELQQSFVTCTFFLQTHVDKSPVFAPPWSIDKRDYSITIMEEQSLGTPIFSLMAKDPMTNQRIEVFEKVFESDPRDYFRVERSGVVLINKRIDYEELPADHKRLSISVKALSQDAYYSVANLNIQVTDLNDNTPQFKLQNYSISISELASYPQEIITVQAEDKDSADYGKVFYSLAGYSSEYFTIDASSGSISIQKGAKLDRDTEPNHSLIVAASDCDTSSGIHPSNAQVDSGGASSRIDNIGCRKSSVFVNISLIDENDNDPIFANVNKLGEFEAITSETVSVGSVITRAQAIDLDEGANGQVSYEIVRNGDDLASKLVRIDRDGYISVAESLSGLGRAIPYRITIRAFDHGKSSRQSFASLLLTISDVVANDGVPRFIRPKQDEVVLLSENAGSSTFVYQVQAVDPDEETNGKLMYKFIQSTNEFEIDPFTGVIKTQFRPNFYLDRELVPNYTLIIVAQDLGSPPKQAHQVLTIKITDVNDNEPYFERGVDDPPLVLYVEEEIPRDSLIGTIQAVDKDVGANALIAYEIIEGNHNNMFKLSFMDTLDGYTNGTSTQNESLVGNNPCKIYSTSRLDRETRESYLLTIRASSMSKMRNPFMHQLKDPLGSRNTFNQYNATDFTKIRVQIKLLDINDNRPAFVQQNAKSVVDSSAEVYSQLLVFKAVDADSSNSEIQYSILDVLYHSDSRYRLNDDTYSATGYHYNGSPGGSQASMQPVSMRHVFDIDPRSGTLRNSVPLRPYIDGYFEVFVKADSGLFNQQSQQGSENDAMLTYNQLSGRKSPEPLFSTRCYENNSDRQSSGPDGARNNNTSSLPYGELENCFVAVTKAVVFVTHQRETFRFVFNKTKLNDRLDEFKVKVQNALEELMFEPTNQALASSQRDSGGYKAGSVSLIGSGNGRGDDSPRAERVYLNTFNTDFFEREDGSLDFNTLTSCSQLVKFDDRSASGGGRADDFEYPPRILNTIVPNQVINYEEVLNLLKTLNTTQTRRDSKGPNGGGVSLFSQYGLVNIERCSTDRTTHKMSISERVALYFAAMMAIVGLLLALIVSRMRKSYEKNLKLLQRSKYQYMNQYATLPPGLQACHHPYNM